VVRPEGLEPPTCGFEGRDDIRPNAADPVKSGSAVSRRRLQNPRVDACPGTRCKLLQTGSSRNDSGRGHCELISALLQSVAMAWAPSAQLTSLASRILGRAHESLAQDLHNCRSAVAADFSRRGIAGPAMVAKIAAEWAEAFLKYSSEITDELLALAVKSERHIDSEIGDWARAELQLNLDRTAGGMSASLKELATERGQPAGGTNDALSNRLSRDIGRALIDAKRDVDIAVDQAVLQSPEPSGTNPVPDPALLDVLLPIKNRRAFEQDLARVLESAKGSTDPFAVVVFDIDHFKQVNDQHGGHATGDEALRDVAAMTERVVRGKGAAYRFGGDEFALLLPNHWLQEAVAVAERLRATVDSTPVTGQALPVSISVGVCAYPDHGTDADSLKRAADDAAYDAKKRGRNLVRVFGEVPPDAATPRVPERKSPAPSALTDDQQVAIRLDYFRNGVAFCPRDEARLNVTETTPFGEATKRIYISCPFCGLAAEPSPHCRLNAWT
jgi:diguanylate cyclase (GGDEF)-like protein